MNIRIVGYLVPDASMPAKHSGWFTLWEAPPNRFGSVALERAASRLRTWEARLTHGSYQGITKVALEVFGELLNHELSGVRALEVAAPEVPK